MTWKLEWRSKDGSKFFYFKSYKQALDKSTKLRMWALPKERLIITRHYTPEELNESL